MAKKRKIGTPAATHEVWVSLAEVEAQEGNEKFPVGQRSFVTGLAFACNAVETEKVLRSTFSTMMFHVIGFEGTERWTIRMRRNRRQSALTKLAEYVKETHRPALDSFHTWRLQG